MNPDDRALQLYTLEYQKAAERYENIYRSMWTIFSYLTAVAAGILAFGSDRIEPHALLCVAASPLLFWFLATYLPLDRYGTDTLRRLGQIEILLNTKFTTTLNHFRPFADKERSVFKDLWQARTSMKEMWGQIRRARFMICAIFVVLLVVVICELAAFYNSGQPLFREKPTSPTAVGRTQNVAITGSSK